jgi:flagellar hook assembly protein FlgD
VVGGGGDLRLAVADVRLGAPELASGIAVAPNPTHGSCSVLFRAAEAGAARVTVHDVTGRVVRRILDGRVEAGGQEVHWDGRDERGREEPAGIYFVTVETENQVRSKKVIMLR